MRVDASVLDPETPTKQPEEPTNETMVQQNSRFNRWYIAMAARLTNSVRNSSFYIRQAPYLRPWRRGTWES